MEQLQIMQLILKLLPDKIRLIEIPRFLVQTVQKF